MGFQHDLWHGLLDLLHLIAAGIAGQYLCDPAPVRAGKFRVINYLEPIVQEIWWVCQMSDALSGIINPRHKFCPCDHQLAAFLKRIATLIRPPYFEAAHT